MSVRVLVGDVRERLADLEDESVQLVITSPPYFSLRDYGTDPVVIGGDRDHAHEWGPPVRSYKANEIPGPSTNVPKNGAYRSVSKEAGCFCSCGAFLGHIGSEPTPDAFVATMVEVFRSIRRVLRKDGVAIINLGDSYSGSGKGTPGPGALINHTARQGFVGASREARDGTATQVKTGQTYGLPPKSLLMIPFRVAMALQQDGWILRSVMPWVKRNSMPESVTDRPANAIEYLFMFARSERYFWDAEAIRQPAPYGYSDGGFRGGDGGYTNGRAFDNSVKAKHGTVKPGDGSSGRSYRNSDPFFATWQGLMLDEAGDPLALVVNPQPNPLAHFASFPPGLVEPFVKAGTSERGCCPTCRAPWRRVVERGESDYRRLKGDRTADEMRAAQAHRGLSPTYSEHRARNHAVTENGTMPSLRAAPALRERWAPTCSHDAGPPIPATVLDPFLGSGTTCLVAERLGRDSVGVELNPEYAEMARRRIEGDCPMFSEVVVEGETAEPTPAGVSKQDGVGKARYVGFNARWKASKEAVS